MKIMIPSIATITLMCALGLQTVPAQASAENNLADFFSINEVNVFLCQQSYLNEGFAQFRTCQTNTEAEVGKLYKAHSSHLHTAKAKAALKAYYAEFLSALDGAAAEPGETKFQYSARQNANMQKLKDLAATVRVENTP